MAVISLDYAMKCHSWPLSGMSPGRHLVVSMMLLLCSDDVSPNRSFNFIIFIYVLHLFQF